MRGASVHEFLNAVDVVYAFFVVSLFAIGSVVSVVAVAALGYLFGFVFRVVP
jgi:hypothetical protein